MDDEGHKLQTPKSTIKVHMWGSLPYITREDCKRLFRELPNKDVPSRDGKQVSAIASSARVARGIALTTKELRERLSHVQDEITPKAMRKLITKYKCIPDQYHNKPEDIITPPGFDTLLSDKLTGPGAPDPPARYTLWEWCAGSAALSAAAKAMHMQHLPPIDYLFGWNLGRFSDQIRLLIGLLCLGVEMLFIAPHCFPWGNNSRALTPSARASARQEEQSTLTFIALACFLQDLLGRRYLLENPGGSDIFDSEESPLKHLQKTGYHTQRLDQCQYGANLEGHFIKKATELQSNQPLPPHNKCDGSHVHLHLRGTGIGGVERHKVPCTVRVFASTCCPLPHCKMPPMGGVVVHQPLFNPVGHKSRW